MWFRNIAVYQLADVPVLATEFEEVLQRRRLTVCGKTQPSTSGWWSPFSSADAPLVHAVNGYWLFCVAKEERILPSSVVNDAVAERVEAISLNEHREVFRKERARLKDELTMQLLPKAFTKKTNTLAYIDLRNKWLVIDSSSANRAEALISLLRETMGSLVATPLQLDESVSARLTGWVLGKFCPANIDIEDQCEMIDPQQEGAVMRCNRHDLTDEVIQQHLERGAMVNRLALTWNDNLSLVLDNSFTFRRIRPLAILTEKRKEVHAETDAEQLDADFSLMTLEFDAMLQDLIKEFGGVAREDGGKSFAPQRQQRGVAEVA